jgi:hypothetical protein
MRTFFSSPVEIVTSPFSASQNFTVLWKTVTFTFLSPTSRSSTSCLWLTLATTLPSALQVMPTA